MSLETRETSLNTVSMDRDMFLDNKTIAVEQEEKKNINIKKIRIDFSFKREVFFIVAGALMGAIVMAIPMTFLYVGIGSGYYLTWIVFGHIIGVHSSISSTIIAGFAIHITTATCIGIAAGLLLYKTNILNISKPSNGLRYGLLVGVIVYLVWAIPVGQFILNPEFGHALSSSTSSSSNITTNNFHKNNNNDVIINVLNPQLKRLISAFIMNMVFGITLGLFSSLLSIKLGARYRCPLLCDISFSRIDILQNHLSLIHGDNPTQNRKTILILGGGFGGVSVLRRLQDNFQTDVSVDIALVSKDNYMLFTPMLHEVASGMIETRHIVTPIRAFCNRSRFYAATVEHIDLDKKHVLIRSSSAPLLDKKRMI
jgi:Pyridine nucleotide-disulphide oxidoreductase